MTARVVRVGDEVRRPVGAWTTSVHALLRHVRERGVTGVPEPLGVAGADAERVSFVEGFVPAYPMPDWVWEDGLLTDAARLLRAYHDATTGFVRDGRRWQLPAHQPDEVICHNDFGPYNLVFRDRRVVGIIDFETAAPGPRVRDVAYLAYRLVPLTAATNPDVPTTLTGVRAERLRRLCTAYGGGQRPAAVLSVAVDRLIELAAFTRAGPAEFRPDARIYEADVEYVREYGPKLLAR